MARAYFAESGFAKVGAVLFHRFLFCCHVGAKAASIPPYFKLEFDLVSGRHAGGRGAAEDSPTIVACLATLAPGRALPTTPTKVAFLLALRPWW